MRRVVDVIAILTVIAVAGAWWMTRGSVKPDDSLEITRLDVDRLRAQIMLRSYSDRETLNDVGWPVTVDPAWFGDELPMNRAVDADRPWLEIASETQSGWRHPRPIFAVDRSTAMFWYNPWLGVVRARVAIQPTDAQTLAHYNTVNSTALTSIDPKTFGDVDAVRLTTADVTPDPGDE